MASGRDELMGGEYMRTQREMEDISLQCARVVNSYCSCFVIQCVVNR